MRFLTSGILVFGLCSALMVSAQSIVPVVAEHVPAAAPNSVELKKLNPWIQQRINNLAEEIHELEKQNPERVKVTRYGQVEEAEMLSLHLQATEGTKLRVVITSGVHGNESLGPLTAIEVVKLFLRQPELSKNIDLTVYPMVNPLGLLDDKRRVRTVVDLNRVFTKESQEPEVVALRQNLEGQHFDLALDLHGGPTKNDFFVISAKEDNGLAKTTLEHISKSLILESNSGTYPGYSGISSDPQRYTMSSPGVATSNLPGTLKAYMANDLNVPYAYTVEYPGRLAPARALAVNRRLVLEFLLSLLERQSSQQ